MAGRPGRVRIRAYGSYNFKITEPRVFFDEIVGTQGLVSTDDIEGFLRRRVVSAFSQAAGKSELSVADMAAHYDVLGNAVAQSIQEDFQKIGMTLTTFIVENISLAARGREGDRRRRGPVGARGRQHDGLGGHAGDARRGPQPGRRLGA